MNVARGFAIRLRFLRKERDWTQEELAERAQITAKYVGQLERGEVSPSLRILAKLSDAFGMTLHELVALPESGEKSREILQNKLSDDELRLIQRALAVLQRVFG